MIARSCALKRTAPPCTLRNIVPTISRPFHSSAGQNDDSRMPNHYETLDVATTATPKEIKTQFYKLSKAYHPDLHPNNPDASQRFVKISEAYATLGSAEKKQRYDRDFMRAQQSSAGAGMGAGGNPTPHGSYSSASTGPGGRPASGLSRRRTQFRGPPPSFYRNGGWGEHAEKRGEHASRASHTNETRGESASGSAGPGMGPGGFSMGFDNDVPHFNNRAHARTQSELERTRLRSRRRRAVYVEEASGGSSMLLNFFMLTGIIAVVIGTTGYVNGPSRPYKKQPEADS